MLDQQFNLENFSRIWDLRNRRGENLERFFPDVEEASWKLRTLSARRSAALKNIPRASPLWDQAALDFTRKKETLTRSRDAILQERLTEVALSANALIDAGQLEWNIQSGPTRSGKATYTIERGNAVTYFIARQIEENLKRAFTIRSAHRNLISEQLHKTLNDETHKFIVRSDIKSFYESIDHARMIRVLRRNASLSRTTIRYVERLLEDYAKQTGDPIGVPRGIGVSSLLAEIFLQQLDETLSAIPGVIAYLRYVDDFIIVFSRSGTAEPDDTRKAHVRTAVRGLGLKMNPSKTKYLSTPIAPGRRSLDFLGYRYTLWGAHMCVDLTPARLAKYVRRIDSAFASCRAQGYSTRAQNALEERMRFLSSNTRLSNNKRNALVGIYYSNSLLDAPTDQIRRIDAHLCTKIAAASHHLTATTGMSSTMFSDGFAMKTFYKHSPSRLAAIVRIWQDD